MKIAKQKPVPRRLDRPEHQISLTWIAKQAGGHKVFVEALRLSDEPEARAFLSAYDNAAKQDQADLDLIREISGVNARYLVSEVAGVAYEHGAGVAKLVAALGIPKVVAKSIQVAQTKEGWRDRKFMLEASGALPAPRGGATTNFNLMFAGGGAPASEAPLEPAPAASAIGQLPSIETENQAAPPSFLEGGK